MNKRTKIILGIIGVFCNNWCYYKKKSNDKEKRKNPIIIDNNETTTNTPNNNNENNESDNKDNDINFNSLFKISDKFKNLNNGIKMPILDLGTWI